MKRELRDKWVTALRSGQYPQGMNALNLNGHFCCLGVLCEMLQLPQRVGDPDNTDDLRIQYYFGDDYWDGGSLGGLVRQDMMSAQQESALISLNDNGHPFAEIAEWIENHITVEG